MTSLSIKPLFISSLLLLCATPSMAQTCKAYIPDNNPDSRYTNNNDGTVTDNDTGLMWKQCVEGLSDINTCATGAVAHYTWQDALRLADTANFATYNDWRLPNLKELESLVTLNCFLPSININLFPNTPVNVETFDDSGVWSSSSVEAVPAYAWGILFDGGSDGALNRAKAYGVRLVRSGQ